MKKIGFCVNIEGVSTLKKGKRYRKHGVINHQES